MNYSHQLISLAPILFSLLFIPSNTLLAQEIPHKKLIITAQDSRSNEAQQLFDEGWQLLQQGQGTQEQTQQALEKFAASLALWRELNNATKEAFVLQAIGLTYYTISDYPQALKYYQQALSIQQQLENPSGIGIMLTSIAGVYSNLGEKQQAIDYYNQAISLFEQLEERSLVATNLTSLAQVYADLGETEKAVDYHQQALDIYQAVEDKEGAADVLQTLGMLYINLGENEKALTAFEQALEIHQTTGDIVSATQTIVSIGLVYTNLGKTQEALQFLNQALEVQRKTNNLFGETFVLSAIATAYSSVNDFPQQLTYLQQALEISRNLGYQHGEATLLESMGFTYDLMGQYQQSLNSFERALKIYEAVEDPAGQAKNHNYLGEIYLERGEYQQSLDAHQTALSIYQKVGNLNGEGETLVYLASVYRSLDDDEQSINTYQQALQIFQKVGNRKEEARILDDLGWAYREQKDEQQALTSFQQSLAVSRAANNKVQEAVTLSNISRIYAALENYNQALESLNQSLQLHQELGNQVGEAGVYAQRSWVYLAQEKYQPALQALNQALPIMSKVGSPLGEANILERIATVQDLLGNQEQSLATYQQELQLRKELADRSGEAKSLYNIARIERQQGNLPAALRHIETALEIIESLRTNIKNQDLRTSLFASKQDYYEFYIDLLMELHQQNPRQNYDGRALQASERARARSLLEMLNEANADIRQGVDSKLLQAQTAAQQQLEAIEKQRVEVLSGKYNPEQKANLDRERENLLRQYLAIREQIRAKSPRYAALTQPQPFSLEQIQQQVLDDDTLLLEYFLGEERSYLWAVSKNGIASYELPPQAEIEAAVKKFRGVVTNRRASSARLLQASQTLSEMILSPVAEQLANQRLVFVSDGVLQYLPFAALHLPQNTEAYTPLITAHEIVNLPSASTLGVLRQETINRKSPSQTLAILADPVFSRQDERVKQNVTPQSNLPVATQQVSRAAREAGVNWSRLLGTRQEAQAILALLPQPAQSTSSFDFASSRAAATSPELSNYRWVHFATHGFVSSAHPELSGIVMSLVNQQGEPENGFLRLHDIFNLNLPVELVVLSACQTGLGETVRGEGVMGLTRGFMYAGVQRVVTSLWSVDDLGTADLMVRLYRGMLQESLQPAAALRAAQLQMWKEGEFTNPYYWAAFTLQGEWGE